MKRLSLLALAFAVMTGIHFMGVPASFETSAGPVELGRDGKACLAVLAFAVVLWVSEALPFAVTSLFVLLLLPALGVAPYAEVVRTGFGNPIITFFIGVLLLSAAFARSGLGPRLALTILLKVGTRTDRVLLGFLVAGASLSMWITDMAVAAIMLPLGVGVLQDAELRPLESNFGRALMIACAFGPLIGGIATPAGTGANPIALSYLQDLAGVEITFLGWMRYGLPAAVLMLPCAWQILLRLFPPELERLPVTHEELEQRLQRMGPLSSGEIKTLVVFTTTIALWLISPFPIQAVALFGGVALFLPGMEILSWKQAQADVDWGGILLIVAGISLGMMVYETGAAEWLALVLLGRIGDVPTLIRPSVIVLGVATLHLFFSSNTVTSTIIMPILVALAASLGLDAWSLAGPAAFTASLAFILVTESPTNVIPYSAGYFSIRDMAKAGIVMTLFAAVSVGLSMTIVGGLE